MIGFLRKNNNNVATALVQNNAEVSSSAGNSSLAKKVNIDSSSASDASNDISISDRRDSNRQPVDGSASFKAQASQKVPGLSLLKVGGIGGAGKQALTARSNNKVGAFRSLNGGIEDCKQSQDGKQAVKIPPLHGGPFAAARPSAFEGGAADAVGGMLSFNNTRGTFRKRMSVLNNDGLSMREKQDLRELLKNVKEVADPSRSGAVFEVKNSALYSGGESTTTDYIPKKPVMEHLKKVEMRHQEKVQLYKQYTIDLREKYQKFEVESQRHYANIIKKHQQQTDEIINNKEALLEQMRQSKEESLDELNLLRAKLYKARAEGKLEKVIEEEDPEEIKAEEEKKLVAAERDEDLDLDRPVDVKAFESLKVYRNKLKNDNIEWINKFKRAHMRDPTDMDLDEIRDKIEEFDAQNRKYILMKAKMIRQGVIPPDLVGKAKAAEAPAAAASGLAPRASVTRSGFFPRGEAAAPVNAFASTKGFQEAFVADPSIKKLREDIQQKEKKNIELEDEIQRLRYNLMDKVGDNDAVLALQKEVEIKESLMNDRDDEIKDLIEAKTVIENEKIALRKEMDELKIKQLLQKNLAMQMKAGARTTPHVDPIASEASRATNEKELNELQEQNEKLKSQVKDLLELQRKTVYGGSMVETGAQMQEQTKAALSKSKIGATDKESEPELKKEKSSESIIAGFLKENEATESAEAPVEGAPVVVDMPESDAKDAEKEAPVVREVAEAGTNMTVSANEAALELQRINDQILEDTRQELAQKEDKVRQMHEQITMLEHALADKEKDMVDQESEHLTARSGDQAEWEKTRAQMQEHIEELGTAIQEKVTALEELEAAKQAIQDTYEERLAAKETELEALSKEHEAIETALKKDLRDLQSLVKDQKASGDEKAKEHQAELIERENALRAEADLKLKEKEDEINQLKEELTFNGKDLQDRMAEINQLQVELANQKAEEEKLIKKIEQLAKEAGNAAQLAEQLKDVTAEKEELMKENDAKQKQLDGVADKFREEQLKRKALLNELEDMKGKIRVYCRIRPFSRTENEDPAKKKMCVNINDEMSLTVKGRFDHNYNFDSVFGPDSTQVQVFDETKRLIQSAVDGYNVCVFAYGQTGSGKTFTIQGSEENPGLTPRSIHELYQIVGQMKSNFEVDLSCYMVEIYKGELRDLLVPKGQKDRPKLDVKLNQQGQVQVKNCIVKPLNNEEDTNNVFETGLGGRQVRKTLMNDESSRSHLIFSIIIDVTNKLNGKKTSGKLSFIDLAGSESSKKTGTDKEGQAEANAINQSLSALGNVISALAEGAKFIRYKENLLTKLMQDSLGGNAKTLMFVNCSPSVYNEMETKNSLEYAKRVKEIKNNPTLNLETKAMQQAHKQIEGQRAFIESLKELATGAGLGDKLAAVVAEYEQKDEEHEGGSLFELNLEALKSEEDANQIKDKPASGRSTVSGRKSDPLDSSRSNKPSGRMSMRPSQSGPISTFKK